MDALAMLCNLYGDGPATLQRLREAGCASCAGLEQITVDDLALILGATPLQARRFKREAESLVARAGEALFASEGDDDSHATRPSAAPQPSTTAAPQPRPIDRALAAWRAWDERDGGPRALDVEGERATEPRGQPLRAELLDGLDGDWCARLRDFGVETLEELAVVDALELSTAMEVPLTRLMRLQGLARRLARATSPDVLIPAPPASAERRFSDDPYATGVEERPLRGESFA